MTKTRQRMVNAAALVLLSIPVAACATGPAKSENNVVKVKIGDLDLESKAGAKVAYGRLKRASREACDVRTLRETGNLHYRTRSMKCYRAELARHVDQIDSEALEALHNS